MQLTIFNELIIHFCCCCSVHRLLISHKPKKIQHRASMACLNEIVDKSLRYIFLKMVALEKITSNIDL